MRIFVASFLFIIFNSAVFAADKKDETNELAQDFTLKSNGGKNIKLSELRGQVVMLNFWASWCGTCIKQLPILNKFHNKYKNKDFTVLSINIEEKTKKAARIAKKLNLDTPVLFDTYNHVSRYYTVSSIPLSILIDRDGYIRHSLNATKISRQKKAQLLIEDLLNE